MTYYVEKPAILDQIDLDVDTVIEASAGTGKTYTIEHLVIELLLRPPAAPGLPRLNLRELLLVTYTEKATVELRKRIREKLQSLLEPTPDQSHPPLGKAYWTIEEAEQQQLLQAFLDFESVGIYTIHGFCNRLLREFAFENRQLFQQQQIAIQHLFPQVFRPYLRQNLSTPEASLLHLYLHTHQVSELEAQFLELLQTPGRMIPELMELPRMLQPLLPHLKALSEWASFQLQEEGACPFLEKFKQLPLKKNLQETTLQSLEELLKALAEYARQPLLEPLFQRLLPLELSLIYAHKFNQATKKQLTLEDFPEAQEFWKHLKKLDEFCQPRRGAIALSVTAWSLRHYSAEQITAQLARIPQAELWVKVLLFHQRLPEFRQALQQYKTERGYFDFDDMLKLVAENLTPQGEGEQPPLLTEAVRQKYAYVLIDEFQDTDPVQWSIFRRLFLESAHRRLLVIGDPKQAIYGFRGADVFTYLEARRLIGERSGKRPVSLTANFRSSPEMVEGLNLLFQQAEGQPFGPEIAFEKVTCGRAGQTLCLDQTGQKAIHFFTLQPAFRLKAGWLEEQTRIKKDPLPVLMAQALQEVCGRTYQGFPAFYQALTQAVSEAELAPYLAKLLKKANLLNANLVKNSFAAQIAQQIQELLQKENVLLLKEGISRPLQAKDLCVLFRSRTEGEILARHLRAHQIPYAFYKQSGLFQTREAQEIYDVLNAVAHPHDRAARAKAWLTRFFSVPLSQIEALQQADSSHPYVKQLFDWHPFAFQAFPQLTERLLHQSGLVQRELFLNGSERETTNYEHLFEILKRQSAQTNFNLEELLFLLQSYIQGKDSPGEEGDLLRLESDQQAVQLMTMHAAKGLEFPVVFLYGGFNARQDDGFFYLYHHEGIRHIDLAKENRSAFEQEQAEEDYRLLYVALTRPKFKLYLPYLEQIPKSEKPTRWYEFNGTYSHILPNLDQIYQALNAQNSGTEELSQYFSQSAIPARLQAQEATEVPFSMLSQAWEASVKVLPEQSQAQACFEAEHSQWRKRARPFTITSFTQLQPHGIRFAHSKPEAEPLAEALISGELLRTTEGDSLQADQRPRESALPRGTNTGSFLHELLEKLDFASLQAFTSWEKWFQTELWKKEGKFYTIAEHYHLEKTEQLKEAAHLIWETLTRPLVWPLFQLPPLIVSAQQHIKEMSFYYPIPEALHPAWEARGLQAGLWKIERGFLTGSLDFVFEYEGRVYWLDWKSNSLEDYSPANLAEVVREHYQLQLEIYTLAVVRWLGLTTQEAYERRFGGVLYLFLRGMAQGGYWSACPSWQEVQGFEQRLCDMNIEPPPVSRFSVVPAPLNL